MNPKIKMSREQQQVGAGWFWKSIQKFSKTEPTIDDLVRKYTAAQTLDELCELGKATNYRPSIYTKGSAEKTRLANAYDARQIELGDPRRAYRG